MSGWMLIWVLAILGLFPLGYGIYIYTNPKERAQLSQRKAGVVFLLIGAAMVFPVLFSLLSVIYHTTPFFH